VTDAEELERCREICNGLYYAQIAMNPDRVAALLAEIREMWHTTEGNQQ